MRKKFLPLLMAALLMMQALGGLAWAVTPEELQSKSAILINADDRQILFEKNANDKLAPASITKIMLLLLVSEKMAAGELKLDQETVVSAAAAGMGGSQVFLEEGETQTMESLLKAVCMRSANDASVAVAEIMYGSEEGCVKAMNDKAAELNMVNTSFVNVTGLPEDSHYSTALDIAIMTSELLKYDYVNQYMTTWMDSIYVGKNKDIEQVLVNTNKLVNNYNGLLGGKTGYTSEAKYCLTAAALRNDTTLIAVVLGCDDTKVRFAEIQKLLNDGFANYKNLLFHKAGDVVTTSKAYCGAEDEFSVICRENISFFTKSDCKIEDFNLEYVVDDKLKAPLSSDNPVGKVTLSKDGEILGEYQLYPEKDVAKKPFTVFYLDKVLEKILK